MYTEKEFDDQNGLYLDVSQHEDSVLADLKWLGLTWDEAKKVLDQQLESLQEFGRFIIAYIYSAVLGDSKVLHSRSLIEQINFQELSFDEDRMRHEWESQKGCQQESCWSFDTSVLEPFRATRPTTSPVADMADVISQQ